MLVARLTKALKAAEQAENEQAEEALDTSTATVRTDDGEVEEDVSPEDGEVPDMSDMIVIDEVCDPSKTKSDETEKDAAPATAEVALPVVAAPPKLSSKEIKALERRYSLPETPQIIVHPSKTAKGGKFDCTAMSLSLLLDYRPEDTKEHSFEVSLFAELFNEMLMRDAGYNIYKALYTLPEKKEATTTSEGKKKAAGDEEKPPSSTDGDGGENKDGKEDNNAKAKEDKKGDKAAALVVAAEKEKKRTVTVNPDLLMSFVYFDQTHCGYILSKDVEDLLCAIGLSLSRAQIRKVVKKMVASDSLYYR